MEKKKFRPALRFERFLVDFLRTALVLRFAAKLSLLCMLGG